MSINKSRSEFAILEQFIKIAIYDVKSNGPGNNGKPFPSLNSLQWAHLIMQRLQPRLEKLIHDFSSSIPLDMLFVNSPESAEVVFYKEMFTLLVEMDSFICRAEVLLRNYNEQNTNSS